MQVNDLWAMDDSRKAATLSTNLLAAWDRRKRIVDDWNARISSMHPTLARRVWWQARTLGDSERYDARLQRWREQRRRRVSLWWALHDIFGFQFWVGGKLAIILSRECLQLLIWRGRILQALLRHRPSRLPIDIKGPPPQPLPPPP